MRDEQIDLRAVIWILKVKSDYFNTCQHPNSDITGGKGQVEGDGQFKIEDSIATGKGNVSFVSPLEEITEKF